MEEMEKRSDRHIRDLVAHTAFKGLDANEIGCARISVMSRPSYPTCNARPVHTDVPLADISWSYDSAAHGASFRSPAYTPAQIDSHGVDP